MHMRIHTCAAKDWTYMNSFNTPRFSHIKLSQDLQDPLESWWAPLSSSEIILCSTDLHVYFASGTNHGIAQAMSLGGSTLLSRQPLHALVGERRPGSKIINKYHKLWSMQCSILTACEQTTGAGSYHIWRHSSSFRCDWDVLMPFRADLLKVARI